MTAKRYAIDPDGCFEEDPDGNLMLYEDVEELAKNYSDLFAKFEKVVEERNQVTKRLAGLRDEIRYLLEQS